MAGLFPTGDENTTMQAKQGKIADRKLQNSRRLRSELGRSFAKLVGRDERVKGALASLRQQCRDLEQ